MNPFRNAIKTGLALGVLAVAGGIFTGLLLLDLNISFLALWIHGGIGTITVIIALYGILLFESEKISDEEKQKRSVFIVRLFPPLLLFGASGICITKGQYNLIIGMVIWTFGAFHTIQYLIEKFDPQKKAAEI